MRISLGGHLKKGGYAIDCLLGVSCWCIDDLDPEGYLSTVLLDPQLHFGVLAEDLTAISRYFIKSGIEIYQNS
jgi:hypothetical protein